MSQTKRQLARGTNYVIQYDGGISLHVIEYTDEDDYEQQMEALRDTYSTEISMKREDLLRLRDLIDELIPPFDQLKTALEANNEQNKGTDQKTE